MSLTGHGDEHLPPGPLPTPAAELASLRSPTVRPDRAEASVRSLAVLLGAHPPLKPWARSLSLPGTCMPRCGVNRRRAWCRTSGERDLQTRQSVQGTN